MSKITINTSDAKSEINKINQKINSQLQSLTKQTTQLSSLLKESDGEFVKELRKQLKAEAEIVAASEAFYTALCQSLVRAVDVYEEQDRKIASGMN